MFCDAASGSRKNSAEFLRLMFAPDFPFRTPAVCYGYDKKRRFTLASLRREGDREAVEGECVHNGTSACHIKTQAPSVSRSLDRADCQASATPKNASNGDFHPKHFLGLKLIDKTMFCKVSLSKE